MPIPVTRPFRPEPELPVALPITFAGSTYGKSTIVRMLERGEVRRLLPGVYTRELAPSLSGWDRLVWEHRLQISASAWKLVPDEAFSHMSAAVLWGLRGFAPPTLARTIAPQRFARQPVGRHRKCAELPEADASIRSGVPVTSLERTVVDYMRELPMHQALAVADMGIRRGADLARMLEINQMTKSNRRRRIAEFLLGIADGGADSPPEAHIRLLALYAGARDLVPQLKVVIAGETFYLDLGDPRIRLALEYDGREKYQQDSGALYREKLREDTLRSAGWTVVRATAQDLKHPGNFVMRLQRTMDRLGASEDAPDFPGRNTMLANWR